jgi:hypothetical protein
MGDDSSSSTFQTLASVLAGGLSGYVDSQNQQPVYVQQVQPQTQYGYAGQGQNTPGVAGGFNLSPTVLIIGAVLAFVLLRK